MVKDALSAAPSSTLGFLLTRSRRYPFPSP
jgi:hypothetical protein